MLEKTSCPSCGGDLSPEDLERQTCPACGDLTSQGNSTRRERPASESAVRPAEPTEALASRWDDAEVAPRLPSPGDSATPRRGAPAGPFPAGPADDGPEVDEPEVDGPEEGVEGGPAGDGTVGDFKTAAPAGGDVTGNWQEGLVVADRFRIVRFVGQGGMGKVYLAQDETLMRPIALKRIPPEIIFDGDARDDLRQEANRLLDLAHENIVRIHTYYDGPTWPFFAMEYLQGPTLKKLLRIRKQYGRAFSPVEVLAIARQVARGLVYAHAKGVIHRDLKPGNLMLAGPPAESITDVDVIKITDFGVSRVIADSTMRQTGKRSGTLPYMSPEQFRGEPCTVQSDVYSLGCTLYELLGGKPPFSMGDLGYQILHVPAKPLPGVPKPTGDAILRAIAKDPRQRFRSVDEFLQALEGKVRVSRPRAAGGLFSMLSMAAAGILLVVVVWLLAQGYFGRDGARTTRSPGAEKGAEIVPRAELPVEESSALLAEKIEFRNRLRAELERQLASPIGRRSIAVVDSSSAPDTLSLRFVFREPAASSYARILLKNVLLQYHMQDASGKWEYVPGTLLEGEKVFELKRLAEGTYTIRAYLEKTVGDATSYEALLDGQPPKFTVDLTPPAFEVAVADDKAFVDSGPPIRSTFDEIVELQLRPARPDDIKDASYQIVYGDSPGPLVPIEVSKPWRLALTQRTTGTYRVHARDAAGNESAPVEIKLRRLDLQVQTFELENVAGNLARVKGLLAVEGQAVPVPRFFVNDVIVPVPAGPPPEPAARSADSPDSSLIPFAETLRLPDPANVIEVRYSWNDASPLPFARPVKLDLVKVRAPTVTFTPPPALHTSRTRLRLDGTVDPWFDGLEVVLDQRTESGQRTWRLALVPVGASATFAHDLELRENEENTVRIQCFYRNQILDPSAAPLSIRCDTRPPRLRDHDGVRMERSGELLAMALYPADELQGLRVQELVGAHLPGEWRSAEWDRMAMAYRYLTPWPSSAVTFRLELTDLAGNTEYVEHFFSPGIPDPSLASLDPALRGATTAAEGEKGPPRSGRMSYIISSPFLQELDIEFVPFGHERQEMARTEVPERAWFRFLRERKRAKADEVGRVDFPMTLGEHSPDLLREFVKWFEEKSDDGYAYEIPTKDQWIMAFSGTGDVPRAHEMVSEWFLGGAKEVGNRFNSYPSVRYGINKPWTIGSRPENRTPITGLLDMEANVQEVVLEGELFRVIGGSNREADTGEIFDRCVRSRPFGTDERSMQARLTGFRLLRRPAPVRAP